MSILDHLWDETVAGPQPDSGLGKLRKLSSFSQPGSPSWVSNGGGVPALNRSITFLRPSTGSPAGLGDSGPASPASVPGSPSPLSPSSTPATPSDWRSVRRKQRAAAESADAVIQPRTPTVYDWVVISSLDR